MLMTPGADCAPGCCRVNIQNVSSDARKYSTGAGFSTIFIKRNIVHSSTQSGGDGVRVGARIHFGADASVEILAALVAVAFLRLHFSWYAAHRPAVHDLLRSAAVWHRSEERRVGKECR